MTEQVTMEGLLLKLLQKLYIHSPLKRGASKIGITSHEFNALLENHSDLPNLVKDILTLVKKDGPSASLSYQWNDIPSILKGLKHFEDNLAQVFKFMKTKSSLREMASNNKEVSDMLKDITKTSIPSNSDVGKKLSKGLSEMVLALECIGGSEECHKEYQEQLDKIKVLLGDPTKDCVDMEGEISPIFRQANKITNMNEFLIKQLWKQAGASLGVPIEVRCGETDHVTEPRYADGATPHDVMLTKLTYLCPVKDNPLMKELKKKMNLTKGKTSAGSSAAEATDGGAVCTGFGSETEISELEEPTDKESMAEKSKTMRKEAKETRRWEMSGPLSRLRDSDSASSVAESYASAKEIAKARKMEENLIWQFQTYQDMKEDNPPNTIPLVDMFSSELNQIGTTLATLDNICCFTHSTTTKNIQVFHKKEKLLLVKQKTKLVLEKENNEDKKKESAQRRQNLDKEYSLREIKSALDYPSWALELRDILSISKDPNYTNNVIKKIKATVKDPSLSTTLKNMTDLSSIVATIKEKFDSTWEKNRDAIRSLRDYKIASYTTKKPPDLRKQLAAVATGTMVLNLFKGDFNDINETLLNILKKEVLHGELLKDLTASLGKLEIQMTVNKATTMDYMSPKDISNMFKNLTEPNKEDPTKILEEDKKSNEIEKKTTELELIYLKFQSATKELQKAEMYEAVENQHSLQTPVHAITQETEPEMEEDQIQYDPEYVFFAQSLRNPTSEKRKQAVKLAILYEKVWRRDRSWEEVKNLYKKCPLECPRKFHPGGSMRFCGVLLEKPLDEIKSLIKIGPTAACKICFIPNNRPNSHDTNKCPLARYNCRFCGNRHPSPVCPNVTLEEKIAKFEEFVKARSSVFTINSSEGNTEEDHLDIKDPLEELSEEEHDAAQVYSTMEETYMEEQNPKYLEHQEEDFFIASGTSDEEEDDQELVAYLQTLTESQVHHIASLPELEEGTESMTLKDQIEQQDQFKVSETCIEPLSIFESMIGFVLQCLCNVCSVNRCIFGLATFVVCILGYLQYHLVYVCHAAETENLTIQPRVPTTQLYKGNMPVINFDPYLKHEGINQRWGKKANNRNQIGKLKKPDKGFHGSTPQNLLRKHKIFWFMSLLALSWLGYTTLDYAGGNKADAVHSINEKYCDSREQKFQNVQTVWLGHSSFKNPDPKKGYETRVIQGITFVKLNTLNDPGSNVNMLCPSVVADFQAKTKIEDGKRDIVSVTSRTSSRMSFLQLQVGIEDEIPIKLHPFLINEQNFGPLTTSPSKIKQIVKKYLLQDIRKGNLPRIDCLNRCSKLQAIIGLSDLRHLGVPVMNEYQMGKLPNLLLMQSKLSNLHYLAGYVDKSLFGTDERKQKSHLYAIQSCCHQGVALSILNEIPIQEESCSIHQFNPLCLACKQCQSMTGGQNEWNEVMGRIEIYETSNGLYKIRASYKFDQDPFKKFPPSLSNKDLAFKKTLAEYTRIVKHVKNGQEILLQQLEKNIRDGGYEILTRKQVEEIIKQPHHFVRTNLVYNEKSKTTKIRTILDPSSYSPTPQTSLNSIMSQLPMKQNLISFILMGFMMHQYPLSLDIKSAFHNIEIEERQRNFQLIAAYDMSQPEWQKHPIVIRCLSAVYGVKQSPQLLEAGIRKIAEIEQLDEATKVVISELRIIDNFLSSYRTQEEMVSAAKKIKGVLDKYNLPLKPLDSSQLGLGRTIPPEESIENLLGQCWNKKTDMVGPAWELNLGKKVRGKHKSDKLSLENVESEKWTRRTTLRLLMSMYDPLGIFCNNFLMNFKTLFSKICKKFPQTDYDIEIGSRDPELRKELVENTKKLLALNLEPKMDRAFLKTTDKVVEVITSCDGSQEGYSCTIHMIIESKNGEKRSRLIRASNKVQDSTVPITELYAYYLAGTILTQVVTGLQTFLAKEEYSKIEYYVLGDSQSSCLQLAFLEKQGTHLTLVKKAKRVFTSLDKAIKDSVSTHKGIKFGWIKSNQNPADINSKSTQTFEQSELWKHGPKMFLEKGSLSKQVWATFTGGNFNLTQNWPHWNPSMYSQGGEKTLKLPLGLKSTALQKGSPQINNLKSNTNKVIETVEKAVEGKIGNWEMGNHQNMTENEKSLQKLGGKEDVVYAIRSLKFESSYFMNIKNTSQNYWIPNEEPVSPLTEEEYEYYIGKSNCFYSILAHLARVMRFIKRSEIQQGKLFSLAFEKLILTSQTIFPPKKVQSYKMEKINKIVCVAHNVGGFGDQVNFCHYLPVINDKRLGEKILWSNHYSEVPITQQIFHLPIITTIANSRIGPYATFIPAAPLIAAEMIKYCGFCQYAHKRTFKSNTQHFQHLIKKEQNRMFSAITLDLVGPIELKAARANSTKKYWILPVFCVLSGASEFYLLDNMRESSILISLLKLQQRYGPIRIIITDAGTNLQNLAEKGKVEHTGDAKKMLNLLEASYQAHPHGQRANLSEYNIKKLKFLLKTLGKGNFKEKIKLLTPLEFELTMAYLKTALESVPYNPSSSLCPKLLKGESIMLPLELTAESQKFKDLQKAQNHILGTLDYFLEQLQKTQLSQNNFFYSAKRGKGGVPKVNDLCLVVDKGLDGKIENDKVRVGRVIEVGKTSAKLIFKNKHSNSYPFENLALVCREPSKHNLEGKSKCGTTSQPEKESSASCDQPAEQSRQIQLRNRKVCTTTK